MGTDIFQQRERTNVTEVDLRHTAWESPEVLPGNLVGSLSDPDICNKC